MKREPRGLYFEDFEIGQEIVSAGRTVTEADIVNFAGLSGDFTELHMNKQYMEDGMFGKRIAHGLPVLSIASGLAIQTNMLDRTIMAFRELVNWKFSQPVYIGDTVRMEMRVSATKPMQRLGGGAVTLDATVKNQDDKTVQSGKWNLLMYSRPAADD